MNIFFKVALIVCFFQPAFAKEDVKSIPKALAIDDIRCEKMTGHSLSDFKMKLFESCDLTKPYSTSLSRLLNEETYLFCCQKKKIEIF